MKCFKVRMEAFSDDYEIVCTKSFKNKYIADLQCEALNKILNDVGVEKRRNERSEQVFAVGIIDLNEPRIWEGFIGYDGKLNY